MIRGRIATLSILIGVNLVALIAIIGTLEFAFGNWHLPYVPPHAAVLDRTLAYRQTLYAPASVVTYTRDRYGLRGLHEPIEEVRLVTLGGSTTDQRYITDGQTWQDVIRSLTGIRIANAGVDGMSSSGHLIAMTEWLYAIPKFSPRVYLHLMGVNDGMLLTGRVGDLPGNTSWTRTLRTRSAIASSIVSLAAWVQGPVDIAHGQFFAGKQAAPAIKAEADRDQIRSFLDTTYRPNLRRILDLHAGRGERAVFVAQNTNPALVKRQGDQIFVSNPRLRSWVIALDMINAETGSICAERVDTCRFIDLPAKLPAEPADFYDTVHATPAGVGKIGQVLARELVEMRQSLGL